jgi:hypothetical protein
MLNWSPQALRSEAPQALLSLVKLPPEGGSHRVSFSPRVSFGADGRHHSVLMATFFVCTIG